MNSIHTLHMKVDMSNSLKFAFKHEIVYSNMIQILHAEVEWSTIILIFAARFLYFINLHNIYDFLCFSRLYNGHMLLSHFTSDMVDWEVLHILKHALTAAGAHCSEIALITSNTKSWTTGRTAQTHWQQSQVMQFQILEKGLHEAKTPPIHQARPLTRALQSW